MLDFWLTKGTFVFPRKHDLTPVDHPAALLLSFQCNLPPLPFCWTCAYTSVSTALKSSVNPIPEINYSCSISFWTGAQDYKCGFGLWKFFRRLFGYVLASLATADLFMILSILNWITHCRSAHQQLSQLASDGQIPIVPFRPGRNGGATGRSENKRSPDDIQATWTRRRDPDAAASRARVHGPSLSKWKKKTRTSTASGHPGSDVRSIDLTAYRLTAQQIWQILVISTCGTIIDLR
jgi:hypothetical protein